MGPAQRIVQHSMAASKIHCGPVREVGADIVAGSLGHASQKAGTGAAASATAADAFGGGGSAAAAAARFAST